MKIKIYQICYSADTLANIPDGFLELDNTPNSRPDWREYWPIRNFLLNNELDNDTLYGFFSPKFIKKTNLDFEKIEVFLTKFYNNQDVVSFSPFWDFCGLFKNIFEQGDFFHPGISNAFQEYINSHLSSELVINDSITHSQNTIFCNYFIAKKSFWDYWLSLGEIMFDEAEKSNSKLSKLLNEDTNYGIQKLPLKIFFQERLATLCLIKNNTFNCCAYDTFALSSSVTPFNKFRQEAIISDALKISYEKTNSYSYLNEFSNIRNKLIKSWSFE